MTHDIILAPEAANDLRRLSARDRAKVRDAMETHLRHAPAKVSKSRIKRLRGLSHPQFRLRVDELRVFYDIEGNEVHVLAVIAKADVDEWLTLEGRNDEDGTTLGS